MQRLSPLDSSFLHIEDASSPMHIASIAIFEGPPPEFTDVVTMVASKLSQVPRYRQKVRFVPFELNRPVWVDDVHFNLEYHVRHTALPSPGSDEQLRNLIGRIMSQALDRSKPLWEMWMVEGLEDQHWALISKSHHAMVDGVSGTDLLAVMLDTSADPSRAEVPPWNPEPELSPAEFLGAAVAERAVSPYEGLRSVRSMVMRPRRLLAEIATTSKGLTSMRGLVRRTEESSLNGPIGPHRRYTWTRGNVSEVKAVRQALGGTLNDVVLAAITQGFRQLLISRGENVEGRHVRSLVPVSVRKAAEKGSYDNRVSAMFAELPVGIDDPVERLHAVTAQLRDLKDSKQAVAGETLTSLAGFAPPALLSAGTRVAMRIPQRNLNTVTTNVPGPRVQLYAAGAKMLEAFPYVPLAGQVRIGVAIFSYLDTLNFGITGDSETNPDLEVLATGIADGLADLKKAAGRA
ncbi:MAG: wax ester/triacylglycerol synthase family O-acyltransferase [Actinomycetota bacterium]|nr:wax ester/triacylglycerol synthase family O-acyltransferase [Actinomycetota bacterium]